MVVNLPWELVDPVGHCQEVACQAVERLQFLDYRSPPPVVEAVGMEGYYQMNCWVQLKVVEEEMVCSWSFGRRRAVLAVVVGGERQQRWVVAFPGVRLPHC